MFKERSNCNRTIKWQSKNPPIRRRKRSNKITKQPTERRKRSNKITKQPTERRKQSSKITKQPTEGRKPETSWFSHGSEK